MVVAEGGRNGQHPADLAGGHGAAKEALIMLMGILIKLIWQRSMDRADWQPDKKTYPQEMVC
jgi:hypothetical protein